MPGSFSFTIDAEIANIPVATDGIADYLTSAGVAAEIIPDIELAVDEAITNIIMHGYRKGPGTIAITCTIEKDRVKIAIRDSAPAFNPLTIPPPDITADLADRVAGGMGIFLIRKVMDEVGYEYKEGQNVLTMEKNTLG
jgi:serine/threonine-protein kinase RsbW